MFCPKCGTQIPDGVKFCPTCGNPMQAAPQQQAQAPAANPQPIYQNPAPAANPQPVYQNSAPAGNSAPVVNTTPAYGNVYQEPAPAPVRAASDDSKVSTPILILGILGLALAFTPVVGIILSAIGRSKAKAYKREFGVLQGKAKVGAGLAKAGLIVGIIMTAYWLLCIIIIGGLVGSGEIDWSDILNAF